MALPTSPSVVVIENDISVFAPNADSSVVGVVGFANKGPTNKATLITSPENLIRIFGEPESAIPGQGLEGAIEILEATNQMYFVRAANTNAAQAEASVTLGASPSLLVTTAASHTDDAATTITYEVRDNNNILKASSTVTVPGTDASKGLNTVGDRISAAFSRDAAGQDVIAYVESNSVFLASKFAGSGASMKLTSPATSGFLFDQVNQNGQGAGAPADNKTADGFTITSGLDLTVKSIYDGAGYNLRTRNDGVVKGLSVEVDNLSILDRLSVNSDGSQKENINANLQPSTLEYLESIIFEDTANNWLNNNSDYIYAEIDNAGASYDGLPDVWGQALTVAVNTNAATGCTPRFVKLVEGTYAFANGNSGWGTVEDPDTGIDITAMVGTSTNKTGIHALDKDILNISLAVAPGFSDDAIQNELITLAETSKNFFALVAPPYGMTEVQDAINWINGQGARTAALNNSYAAVYWPWVQVFNPFAGKEEWYDPSIFAARQCVFTDSVAEPWFAPAGFRRGRLTKPTDTEVNVNQGDRDALYVNNVNPISNEPQTGITVFGQKTTQRLPTALDRVNVRRLMIYIRKVLLEIGKPFQFEPNDEFTWEQVEGAVKPFLNDLTARRAIVESAVKCDSSTNTPLRVDRNELWCSVTIKPTKAAETVVFEVNLTSQSATIA